jgi:hypothetical protein
MCASIIAATTWKAAADFELEQGVNWSCGMPLARINEGEEV